MDNFLVEVMENLTRGEALLDLLLTSAEEFTKKDKTGGSLASSNHVLVEFSALRGIG